MSEEPEMSDLKWTLQSDPASESFDWNPEGSMVLHKAEQAAFEAYKKWDPSAQYVPAVRWQAASRAALSAYYAALVEAGWITPRD